jgi:hypothetical protein
LRFSCAQRSRTAARAVACPPPAGRLFFKTKEENGVALGGEVRDVLGDDGPACARAAAATCASGAPRRCPPALRVRT